MSEMNEKWSSLEETAEYLGVTKDTIRSWIKKTDIPAHKVVDFGNLNFPKLMNGLKAERVRYKI